jgi:VWFA-related protein
VGRILRRLVVLSVLPLGAASLFAQEPGPETPVPGEETPPRFGAGVEQVVVDLVVIDRKGNPVPGLTSDDMVVKEDGIPQKIVSFEAVALPDEPVPPAAPPPRVSKNTDVAAQRGRSFVIVFDDMNLTPYRARDAKAAVASFLETGVREGDLVTLVATSGEAWWTSRMTAGRESLIDIVKRLEGRRIPDTSLDRLTDWEAMRIHIYNDRQVAERVMQRYEALGVMTMVQAEPDNPLSGATVDPIVTGKARDVYLETRARNQVTLEALERVLSGLAAVKGRKSVILVSEGFIRDPSLEDFRRVTLASRRGNAAIYFLNARGLEGMPIEFSAQFGPALPTPDIGFALSAASALDDGAEDLADESGGFTVRNTNDLESGIQRIARETQMYYLLGYVPTNAARDGTYRRIEVELKDGEGRRVRARKGYYAPSGDDSVPVAEEERVDPVVQAALDSPWAEDGIPLRMTHYVRGEQTLGKAQVVLVTEVDVNALHFEAAEGRDVAEIEFLLVVAHRDSGEFYRYDQKVTMRLRPATLQRLRRDWYPIVREFQLPPGDHQAKIIVRETHTGLLGSVSHELEVPPLDTFRVSTPVLSDTWHPGPPGTAIQPQLLARREFPQGAEVACQFEVYGAARDEQGMPRVTQGYRVLGPDGSVYKTLPESVISPTADGQVVRLFVLSLEYATPGDYRMAMTFRDELAGKVLQLEELFTVSPPRAASARAE